ncbi:MAG: DUF2950 domain-containing protein [Burkholderiaceae bacterium]
MLRQLALAMLLSMPFVAAAQQRNFATPDEAVDALFTALKADDDAALIAIFGDKYKNLIATPDRATNSATRARLAAGLQTFRVLNEQGANRRVLLIGDQAWPLPIPIVRANDRWRFATEEGNGELVNRRIGANERNAIYVLRAYLDAQKAYAAQARDGDVVRKYAQRLASTKGKHDGLYWEADPAKGEELSPFGPLVAEAAGDLQNYKTRAPFRGYQFKVLTRQGKNAPGEAYNYVINGRMIAGHAMVAYPATYGETGVMTFIVSHAGKIYERDLGKNSAAVGAAMTTFDPGPGWKEVTDQGG